MKRKMSREGRQRIREATQRRWARYRAEKKNENGLSDSLVTKRKTKRRANKKRLMAKVTPLIANLLRMLPDEQLVKLVKTR